MKMADLCACPEKAEKKNSDKGVGKAAEEEEKKGKKQGKDIEGLSSFFPKKEFYCRKKEAKMESG